MEECFSAFSVFFNQKHPFTSGIVVNFWIGTY